MNSIRKIIIFILLILLSLLVTAAPVERSVKLSNKLLRVSQPPIFHHQVGKGFAVFDSGSNMLKFFDWNFSKLKQFPVPLGEGPGEIKQNVLSLCFLDDTYYMIGVIDHKLNLYDKNGLFLKSHRLQFVPRRMAVYGGELYVFNMGFGSKTVNPLLCKVFSPGLRSSRDITLRGKLALEKAAGGHPLMLGLSSLFTVSANGNIIILVNGPGVLLVIDQEGKLRGQLTLPYKERSMIKAVKGEKGTENVLSVIDMFNSLKSYDDGIYATFYQHMGTDGGNGGDVYRTVLLRILEDGQHDQRTARGRCVMIGKKNSLVYLFDEDTYAVSSREFR